MRKFWKSNDKTAKDTVGKPYTLFKILGVIAILGVVLTWFIPSGTFSGTELVELSTKLGIGDMFMGGFYSAQYFLSQIVMLLSLGGFYGVISKTVAYKNCVDKCAKWVKKHKIVAILVISLILACLAGIFLHVLPLVIFLPFIIAVLNKAGIDKFVTFATTFGALMIGIVGFAYSGFGLDTMYQTLGSSVENNLWSHVVIFVLAYILLNMFSVMRVTNQDRKAEVMEEKFEPDVTHEKSTAIPVILLFVVFIAIFATYFLRNLISLDPLVLMGLLAAGLFIVGFIGYFRLSKNKAVRTWPLICVSALLFVIIILGYVNWGTLMENVTFFNEFHTWLTTDIVVTMAGEEFALFDALIGTHAQFGQWNLFVGAMFLIVFAIVAGKTYKMSSDEIISNFVSGAKVMMGPTILFVLAHMLVVYCNWLPIINKFVYEIVNWSDGYSMAIVMILGFVIAFFAPDPGFSTYSVGAYLAVVFANNVNEAGLIINTMYGFAQFVVPTGLLLFAGLHYCNISYTSWLKYIWKFMLGLLAALVLVYWLF